MWEHWLFYYRPRVLPHRDRGIKALIEKHRWELLHCARAGKGHQHLRERASSSSPTQLGITFESRWQLRGPSTNQAAWCRVEDSSLNISFYVGGDALHHRTFITQLFCGTGIRDREKRNKVRYVILSWKIKHKISFINMVSRKIKQEERGGLLSGSYMVNYNLGC